MIEDIWWQTTLHREGMAYLENIEVTSFIIMRSTIWIATKPCKCDWRSILPKVEDVNNRLTLCKGPSQFIFIGWSSPTWWCRCKGSLNRVLWKFTHTPTTYALTLKDFLNFVESQGPFFDTPLMKGLKLLPHEWWDLIGVGGCTFAPITRCILA
jgi:hypothetical protein